MTIPGAAHQVAGWTLVCLVLCATACTSRSAKSTSPDLKETTDWINDTYNNHGLNRRALLTNGIYETQDERTTTLHIENCVGTIEEKQRGDLPMSSSVVLVGDLQTFKFSDIDPSHIKIERTSSNVGGVLCDDSAPDSNVTCNQADIGLHTRNDRPLIKSERVAEFPKLTGADHRSVTESTSEVAFLYVNDLEYVPRLVSAIKREIELCGGKPSPF